MDASGIRWEPYRPTNAAYWSEKICSLVQQIDQRRKGNKFLRLSRTSQASVTWSLPAVSSCPTSDETCQHCYALSGVYRIGLPGQIDRALRLDHLRGLIRANRLPEWVDWMVSQLNELRPEEPFQPTLRSDLPGALKCETGVRYMRWHDSGDIFHEDYAKAIVQVCERTPTVAHWLPTRMGSLINTLVQQRVAIPPNMSITVSVHYGGRLEHLQKHAVSDVLKVQPSARIGHTYVVAGPKSRRPDMQNITTQFGRDAVVCQAIAAEQSKERVCAGCRHCWAANIARPVIYPQY